MSALRAVRLETARLVIAATRTDDAAAAVAYVSANREHLAPWSPVPPVDWYDEGAWRTRLAAWDRERRRGQALRTFLRDRDGGPILGTANLTRITRGAFEACNLGYSLAREAEGKGLMAEALDALLCHAFGELGLHRVEANHMPANIRSEALLRRLGFQREGYARGYLRIAGRWEDHVLNALTRG